MQPMKPPEKSAQKKKKKICRGGSDITMAIGQWAAASDSPRPRFQELKKKREADVSNILVSFSSRLI